MPYSIESRRLASSSTGPSIQVVEDARAHVGFVSPESGDVSAEMGASSAFIRCERRTGTYEAFTTPRPACHPQPAQTGL
jgi:hypothetical protein